MVQLLQTTSLRCSRSPLGASCADCPEEYSSDLDEQTTASGDGSADADALTPSSSDMGILPRAPSGCTWRLIWCHERCHKEEKAEMRSSLQEAAAAAGAALICFKKASKFESWNARAWRPPYILLTDWREVKPCMALTEAGGHQPPLLTVVLCEGPDMKLFHRASAWAASLLRDGSLRVCKDLDFLLAFLAGHEPPRQQPSIAYWPEAEEAAGRGAVDAAAVALPPPAQQKRAAAVQGAFATVGALEAQAGPLLTLPGLQQRQAPPSPDARVPCLARHPFHPAPCGGRAQLLDEFAAGGSPAAVWVEEVVSYYGARTMVEVERLLQAAVPNCYED